MTLFRPGTALDVACSRHDAKPGEFCDPQAESICIGRILFAFTHEKPEPVVPPEPEWSPYP